MKNKQINVTKTFMPPYEEYCDMIEPLWKSNWITNNGEMHMRLERELNSYLNTKNATLYTNGHLALVAAIKTLNMNGEVITTPFSFASTTHAIVESGLTPVFCDIKMSDFTIDEDKIEALITPKTCAIMPVHVFGFPCNILAIEKIAIKYNLKVIYDAAHCFGVRINGCGIGQFGDISMFSFHATKIFHTIEGGLLTYNNAELKKPLIMQKNFGITGPEKVESLGGNAKMNEFQAAMGLLNLKYIDSQILERKRVVEQYIELLKDIEGIYTPILDENIEMNYAYFPILINKEVLGVSRNEIFEGLKSAEIFTRKYFYPLITDYGCYKNKYDASHLDNARIVSEQILTLPLYAELSHEDVIRIITEFSKIIKNKRGLK